MAHHALFGHVKFRRLVSKVGIPAPHVLGHWEYLCDYVGTRYPDGDISQLEDEDIEMAAEWGGEAGHLLACLIDCRFVDRDEAGTRLHDWLDWCPEHVKKRASRKADAAVRRRTADNGAGRQTTAPPCKDRQDGMQTKDLRSKTADSGGRCLPMSADVCPIGEDRIGEDRIGEDRIGEDRIGEKTQTLQGMSTSPTKSVCPVTKKPAKKESGAGGKDDRTWGKGTIKYHRDRVTFIGVTKQDLGRWAEAYPACDIDIELKRMAEWINANPAKGKKSRYETFITNWLNRTQDKGGSDRGQGNHGQAARTGAGKGGQASGTSSGQRRRLREGRPAPQEPLPIFRP